MGSPSSVLKLVLVALFVSIVLGLRFMGVVFYIT